jgi:uncharacterized membrane protein
MPYAARLLRLLSLVVWIGGIVFFAFVMAPVAFHNLPSPHEAGLVVRGTIGILHIMGFVCGGLFLVATVLLLPGSTARVKSNLLAQTALVALMLAITAISQFGVIAPMEADRLQAGGIVESVPPTNPARIHFERLHVLSERLEGAVLFLGLGACLLLARRPGEASY